MASEQTAPVDLDLLDDLRAKATPGEWRLEIDNVFSGPKSKSVYVADCEPMGGPHGGTRRGRADAALIVAAVNALPALIDELRAAREALECVVDLCPATCEASPAHDMAEVARTALAAAADAAGASIAHDANA